MIDMPPILDGFDREPVTWHVFPASTIDTALGEVARGTADDMLDDVVLHPATRRQLAVLHDGAQHATEPLAVYTTAEVYAGGETSHATEMTRARDGRRYEVINVGDYQGQAGVSLVLLSLIEDP